MAKRKKKEEEGAKQDWLTSYADLVTILFAMFVMLYALSDIDETLWVEFAMAAAIGSPASPFDFADEGINELTGNGVMALPRFELAVFQFQPGLDGNDGDTDHQHVNQMEAVYADLQTYFAEAAAALPEGADIDVEFDAEAQQILISTHGDVYFDTGQANIRPETYPILDVIGSAISQIDGAVVSIEGHTDNVPIRTALFYDNWDLSSARANNILRHFVYNLGVISPYNIQAVGRGEYQPVADNLTPEGRQANRRVEIRISAADNNAAGATIGVTPYVTPYEDAAD